MKNYQLAKQIMPMLAFLVMAMTFSACKKDKGSTNFGIHPESQPNMTNVALQINGKLTEGGMPSARTGSGTQLSISAPFTLFEVSGGTALYFPISTNSDSSICTVYLQVKGAASFWEAPVVRDSFGQLSIRIFVPNVVQNNRFQLMFSVADCDGNISQPVTTTISITDHPTQILGASGTPRFNLQFSSTTVDFDLHVKTPNGNVIYYGNKTADNGTLDYDCICCSTPNENIFWEPGTAAPGKYEYWVHFYDNCGTGPSSYILRVYKNSDLMQFHTGTLTTVGSNSAHFIYMHS